MRRGVCASFYRLKSRLRITVQMIFFRVRTRNPLAHAAPNRTPSSSSRAPSAHTRMYVRTRIPSRSCASSSVTSPCLRYSSTNLRRSFRWMVVQRSCMGRQHCSLSTPPPPSPRTTQKEFKTGGARTRREMTRRRANKKEARSGILVIFTAPGACVTRVPVPEISRLPSFPSADRRSYVPA